MKSNIIVQVRNTKPKPKVWVKKAIQLLVVNG